jgi:hypothetical protein
LTDEAAPQTVIRTPDQRLRVFVSSTLGELADERAAVARAITALRLTPVMSPSTATAAPSGSEPNAASGTPSTRIALCRCRRR